MCAEFEIEDLKLSVIVEVENKKTVVEDCGGLWRIVEEVVVFNLAAEVWRRQRFVRMEIRFGRSSYGRSEAGIRFRGLEAGGFEVLRVAWGFVSILVEHG